MGSKEALRRAKKNVEQVFPVVGVIEHLDSTLRLLERRLPRFFQGVRDLYYGKLKGEIFCETSNDPFCQNRTRIDSS